VAHILQTKLELSGQLNYSGNDKTKKGDSDMEKKQLEINEAKSVAADEGKAKKKWQKPKLEDVSGKVMAQPYIRFT